VGHSINQKNKTMLTQQQLQSIAIYGSPQKVATYLPMLNDTMAKYDITTALRAAHFLAQIIHESGSFNYTVELDSGMAYEYRADLGNTQKGDGPLYKGRGFIQLTGRANYAHYGLFVHDDLINHPDLVATKYPADVSGWFWASHSLNALADADNVNAITRMINGGYNGLQDRIFYLQKAKAVLMEN
jgi:putative chitinase